MEILLWWEHFKKCLTLKRNHKTSHQLQNVYSGLFQLKTSCKEKLATQKTQLVKEK